MQEVSMTTDVRSIYQESLRNTHAEERQGLTQMEAQVKGLDAYPDYQALLQRHVATTRTQIGRIEAALEAAGAGCGGLREAVTNAVGAAGTALHGVMPDTTLKNLYAGYAFQFHQIAAYKSLAVIAEAAGFGADKGWIDQTIAEEEAAAREVEAIIPSVTRAFLDKQGR
jgi:ferritin-like metal-binding protein YciE